jgi:hypothetical protein
MTRGMPRTLVLLIAATLLSHPFGLALGVPVLLPLLNAAPAYAAMAILLRRGDRHGAVLAMLVWAAAMAIGGTLTLALWPSLPDALVIHGAAYREEMFHWIRTGEGSEGSLRLFLPQHLLHLTAFLLLSLATASAASIVLGAVLVNYMDFYVASLYRAGVPAWAALLLGWQPWAIVRVAAFATLGAVLAEPALSRVLRYPYAGITASRRFLLWSAALLLADWTLKALLAPTWGRLLQTLLPAAG